MISEEPIYDVAHLAHVELLTPTLEESRKFFVNIMGMVESGRESDSVYLRGWDDYEHHSLQLTAAAQPGIGHYALRASSPQALQRRVTGWKIPDLAGLERSQCWTWSCVLFHRSRRAQDGNLLRNGVVQSARTPAPGAQETRTASRIKASACGGLTISTCWQRMCAPTGFLCSEPSVPA